jgi:serine/threonine protein kinase
MAGTFALSYIGGSFAADTINSADTRSGAGSPRWMAPELLVPEAHNKTSARPTFESDVFSFGMLIYEVIRSYLIPTTAHYFNKDLQWLGTIPR